MVVHPGAEGLVANELEQLPQALAERYRVGDEIGRGGMATVYRAPDLQHRAVPPRDHPHRPAGSSPHPALARFRSGTCGARRTSRLLAHADQVSIVSPQVFVMDSNGVLNNSTARPAAGAKATWDSVQLMTNRGRGLRGYSVWLLGSEDPAVWPALRSASPTHRQGCRLT